MNKILILFVIFATLLVAIESPCECPAIGGSQYNEEWPLYSQEVINTSLEDIIVREANNQFLSNIASVNMVISYYTTNYPTQDIYRNITYTTWKPLMHRYTCMDVRKYVTNLSSELAYNSNWEMYVGWYLTYQEHKETYLKEFKCLYCEEKEFPALKDNEIIRFKWQHRWNQPVQSKIDECTDINGTIQTEQAQVGTSCMNTSRCVTSCDENQTLDTNVTPPVCIDNPPTCDQNDTTFPTLKDKESVIYNWTAHDDLSAQCSAVSGDVQHSLVSCVDNYRCTCPYTPYPDMADNEEELFNWAENSSTDRSAECSTLGGHVDSSRVACTTLYRCVRETEKPPKICD